MLPLPAFVFLAPRCGRHVSYFVHEIPTPEQTATLLGSYGEPPEDTEEAHRFGARSAPYPRQLGRGYLAKNSDAAPGGSGSAK
jgi:hypothetical protein